MKSLDMFSARSEAPRRIVLPAASARGEVRSRHVVSLRPWDSSDDQKSEEVLPTTLSIPDQILVPRSFHVSAPRSRGITFFRKIRDMLALGVIFFLLLGGGKSLHSMELLKADLEKRKDDLFREVKSLKEQVDGGDISTLQTGLVRLDRDLQVSARLFRVPTFLSDEVTSDDVVSSFRAARLLLAAGREGTEIGQILLREKESLQEELPALLNGEESLLPIFRRLTMAGTEVHRKIQKMQTLFELTDGAPLPGVVKEQVENARTSLEKIDAMLVKSQTYQPALETLLGARYPHMILVLLQNKNELRFSGGFPGSVLLVELDQGRVSKLRFEDIFHFSGQSTLDLPVPPEFAHLTGGWFVHDCNRDPDFRTTAAYCQRLFEYSKGPTPDTIIAIHNGMLEDLLQLIGPIPLPGREEILLDEKNISFVLSFLVEAKIFGDGGIDSPKNILRELLPQIWQGASEVENRKALLDLGEQWTHRKDIQISSRDKGLEQLWEDLGVAGKYIPDEENTDFLGVVQANVGGNKSDAYIRQDITEKTLVNLEGEMFHQVEITRRHNWGELQEHQFTELWNTFGSGALKKEDLKNILGAAENRSFTKVYFPKGTQFLSSENIRSGDVRKEEGSNYTAFSFFFPSVPAGQEVKTALFVAAPVLLNIRAGDLLKFVALTQPGQKNQYFSKEFLFESGLVLEGPKINQEAFLENRESIYLLRAENARAG